jgi:hypothetical protein
MTSLRAFIFKIYVDKTSHSHTRFAYTPPVSSYSMLTFLLAVLTAFALFAVSQSSPQALAPRASTTCSYVCPTINVSAILNLQLRYSNDLSSILQQGDTFLDSLTADNILTCSYFIDSNGNLVTCTYDTVSCSSRLYADIYKLLIEPCICIRIMVN